MQAMNYQEKKCPNCKNIKSIKYKHEIICVSCGFVLDDFDPVCTYTENIPINKPTKINTEDNEFLLDIQTLFKLPDSIIDQTIEIFQEYKDKVHGSIRGFNCCH